MVLFKSSLPQTEDLGGPQSVGSQELDTTECLALFTFTFFTFSDLLFTFFSIQLVSEQCWSLQL